jgi:hypothetical protein
LISNSRFMFLKRFKPWFEFENPFDSNSKLQPRIPNFFLPPIFFLYLAQMVHSANHRPTSPPPSSFSQPTPPPPPG